jgi:hypothetical protein
MSLMVPAGVYLTNRVISGRLDRPSEVTAIALSVADSDRTRGRL